MMGWTVYSVLADTPTQPMSSAVTTVDSQEPLTTSLQSATSAVTTIDSQDSPTPSTQSATSAVTTVDTPEPPTPSTQSATSAITTIDSPEPPTTSPQSATSAITTIDTPEPLTELKTQTPTSAINTFVFQTDTTTVRVSLSDTQFEVNETSRMIELTILLSDPLSFAFTLAGALKTHDITAKSAVDYTAGPYNVVFPSNQTSTTVTIPIIDKVEPHYFDAVAAIQNRLFSVELDVDTVIQGINVTTGKTSQATVTILDNDTNVDAFLYFIDLMLERDIAQFSDRSIYNDKLSLWNQDTITISIIDGSTQDRINTVEDVVQDINQIVGYDLLVFDTTLLNNADITVEFGAILLDNVNGYASTSLDSNENIESAVIVMGVESDYVFAHELLHALGVYSHTLFRETQQTLSMDSFLVNDSTPQWEISILTEVLLKWLYNDYGLKTGDDIYQIADKLGFKDHPILDMTCSPPYFMGCAIVDTPPSEQYKLEVFDVNKKPYDLASVSAGSEHTCGIDSYGWVLCWGEDTYGQISVPSSVFQKISAGGFHTCGIKQDNTIECWGAGKNSIGVSPHYGQATPPQNTLFTDVTSGYLHTCGIVKDSSTVLCWGDDTHGQSTPSVQTTFTSVSAGKYHTCGIRADNANVECWGSNAYNQAAPPSNAEFTTISAGGFHTCGIKQDNTVECWGAGTTNSGTDNKYGQSLPPVNVKFDFISAGELHTCGITETGFAMCWGSNNEGQSLPLKSDIPFKAITAGKDHTCALEKHTSYVYCWGGNGNSYADVPSPINLSVGYFHACMVLASGELKCWGNNNNGESTPPAGVKFTQVSTGVAHTCGIRADNQKVQCWGQNGHDRATPPINSVFTAISTKYRHTCGTLVDQTIECWGDNNYGQSTPPADVKFTQVSSGYWFFTCGLLTDGSVQCWGRNNYGQSDPPSDIKFSYLSAGSSHICGIRLDNQEAECWGRNNYGQSNPPSGVKFSYLSSGSSHTCGIRLDNQEAECWGRNNHGQSNPPSDIKFSHIRSGANTTCGIQINGKTTCWGSNDNTLANPPTTGYKTGLIASYFELSQITTSSENSCVRLKTGNIICWRDYKEIVLPTTSVFTYISTYKSHSDDNENYVCAIRRDETVECWGNNAFDKATPPSGVKFTKIDTGLAHACGIRSDNKEVQCWGYNAGGRATPPSNSMFTDISTRDDHTCGTLVDGTAKCWGNNNYGQSAPPAGVKFTQVSTGFWYFTCGLLTDGSVQCWGADWDDQTTPPAGIKFSQISTGGNHTCGIRLDNQEVQCWGANDYGESQPPVGIKFSHIHSGHDHTCGLLIDQTIRCWGKNTFTEYNSLASVKFTQISESCGIRSDGRIECLMWDTLSDTIQSDERFSSIALSLDSLCGLDLENNIRCWGNTGHLPFNDFVSLKGGINRLCGTTDKGTFECWPRSYPPLPGSFEYIDSSWSYSCNDECHTENIGSETFLCGIRPDSTLYCWGNNSYGQIESPTGEFSTVNTGYRHACGIRKYSNEIECWGAGKSTTGVLPHYGQAKPPSGQFKAISTGHWHTCGIRSDNTVECWGLGSDINNIRESSDAGLDQDQSVVPIHLQAVEFDSISASERYTCGVTKAGNIECWGEYITPIPPTLGVSFDKSVYNKLLEESGKVSVTIVRDSKVSLEELSVHVYLLSKSPAQRGRDFQFISPTTVDFADGQTQAVVTFATDDNQQPEPYKQLGLLIQGEFLQPPNTPLADVFIQDKDYKIDVTTSVDTVVFKQYRDTTIHEVDFIFESNKAVPHTVAVSLEWSGAVDIATGLADTVLIPPNLTTARLTVQVGSAGLLTDSSVLRATVSSASVLSVPMIACTAHCPKYDIPLIGLPATSGFLSISQRNLSNLIVSISADKTSVTEGSTDSTAIFTVEVTPDTLLEVITVAVSFSGTAQQGKDYRVLGLPNVFTFIPDSNSKQTFAVTVTDDAIHEFIETIQAELSGNLPQGVVYGNEVTSLTINDNDDLVVSITADRASITEGSTDSTAIFTVEVTRTDSPQTVTLAVSISGTAQQGKDYGVLGLPNVITFIPDSSSKQTFAVTVIDDAIHEFIETIQAELSGNLPNGVVYGNEVTSLTINDNDDLVVSITADKASITEGSNDSTAIFTIEVTPDTILEFITVEVSISGTAQQGKDYTVLGLPNVITFTPDSNSKQTFAVTVIDDDFHETTESIKAELSGDLPQGVVYGNTVASLTINDNDDLVVSITTDKASITEGSNDSTAIFTIEVTPDTILEFITVAVSFSGTAQQGKDYGVLGLPNVITFIPDSSSKQTFAVTVTDDDFHETTESIKAELSGNLPNGVVYGNKVASLTINDNDDLVVSITADRDSITEGSTDSTTIFTLEVTPDTILEFITVAVSFSGTAQQGKDYTVFGLPSNNVFTFTPDSNNKQTFALTVTDDVIHEFIETIQVELSGNLPQGVVYGNKVTSLTINDNDDLVVSITADKASITEGSNDSTTIFTLEVTPDTILEFITVAVSFSGTAQQGKDYNVLGLPNVFKFTPDSNNKQTFAVTVTDDDFHETTESIKAELSGNLPNGVVYGNKVASLTINDNDDLVVSITTDRDSITEGSTDSIAIFTVEVTPDTLLEVITVAISFSGTAQQGKDYTVFGLPNVITFIPDSSSKQTFALTVIDDDFHETTEAIKAELYGNLPQGVVYGNKVTSLTINDNDDLVVSITTDKASITEGSNDSTAIFTIEVTPDTILEFITVAVSFSGTAQQGKDYGVLGLPNVITFIPDSSSKQTFAVTVTDDDFHETTESIKAELSGNLPNGVVYGNKVASLTINDNDDLVVSITADKASITEGSTDSIAIFTVEVTPDTLLEVITVAISFSGTAQQGKDYTVFGLPNVITFIPDSSSKQTFALTVIDDDFHETTEAIKAELYGNLPQGVVYGNKVTSLTINDNDDLVVSITTDKASITEGSNDSTAIFTIEVTPDTILEFITVAVSFSGTAQQGKDYGVLGLPNVITFIPDSSSKQTFAVTVTDDDFHETTESIKAELSGNLPNGVVYGNKVTSLTINDNDDLVVSITADKASITEGSTDSTTIFTLEVTPDTILEFITVAVSFSGTAQQGKDYNVLGLPNVFKFTPDSNNKQTFAVTVTDDDFHETTESIKAELSGNLPQGVMYGNTVASLTINDNDDLVVSITADKASITEGSNDSTAIFTIEVTPDTILEVITVEVSISGTAQQGKDYGVLGLPNVFTFIPDSSSKQTFALTVIDDVIHEFIETIQAELSGALPQGVVYGNTVASLTINDNDDLVVSITADRDSITEGSTDSTAIFTIEVTPDTILEFITVAVSISGTAQQGKDYEVSDLTDTNIFTFIPDSSSKQTFAVTVTDDDFHETTESIKAELSGNLPNGVVYGNKVTSLTINDNDDLVVSITADKASITEGSTDSTTIFTLEVTPDTILEFITVAVSFSGTAQQGKDYNVLGLPNVFKFTPDSNNKQTFAVTVTDDDFHETTESIKAELSGNLPNGVVYGNKVTSLTINDNDDLVVSITTDKTSVTEGSTDSTAIFTIEITTDTLQVITVAVSFSGTAQQGKDYEMLGLPNVITFTPDSNNKQTFAVTVTDDVIHEFIETIKAELSGNLPQGVVYGNKVTSLTINDNDDLVVSITADKASITEGSTDSTAIFTIKVTPDTILEVITVAVSFSGTAQQGKDYGVLGLPNVFTFIPDSNSKQTFALTVIDDVIHEFIETIQAELSGNLPQGVVYGNTVASLTINDNDDLVVSITTDKASITEGSTDSIAIFTIEVTPDTISEVITVAVSISGTAQQGKDYNVFGLPSNNVFTFTPDSNNKQTFAVTVTDDVIHEFIETIQVELSGNLPQGVVYGNKVASITINDNDDLVVSITADKASITEGSNDSIAIFTVEVTPDTILEVITVAVSISGTAQQGKDYGVLGLPNVFTFIPDSSSKQTFAVTVIDDVIHEFIETIQAELSGNLPQGVVYGNTVASITINDNDVILVNIDTDKTSITEGQEVTITIGLYPQTPKLLVQQTVAVMLLFGGDTSAYRVTTTLLSGSIVNLSPADPVATINISAIDNTAVNASTRIDVTAVVDNLPIGLRFGTQQVTVNILDNDTLPPAPVIPPPVFITPPPSSGGSSSSGGGSSSSGSSSSSSETEVEPEPEPEPEPVVFTEEVADTSYEVTLPPSVSTTFDTAKSSITKMDIYKEEDIPKLPLQVRVFESVDIKLYDKAGSSITEVAEGAQVCFEVTQEVSDEVEQDYSLLTVYRLEEDTEEWTSLESSYKEDSNRVCAESEHFSLFALGYVDKSILLPPTGGTLPNVITLLIITLLGWVFVLAGITYTTVVIYKIRL